MIKHKFNDIQIFDYESNLPPLVFLHAFPLSSLMWKYQVDYFKDNYRVITYDVKGLGESKTDNYLYMMENFVNDFYSVLNYLSIEKAIVCGLSMGGYITLRAAIKYPDKFSAIILADTRAEKDDDTGLITRANSIDQIKAGKLKEFFGDFLTKLISKNSINNSELIALLNVIMDKQTPEGICAALIVLATRTNTIDLLDTLNIPSLIIVGEEDVLTPLKFAENMHNKLNHSKLEIIPGAGHLSNLENPSKFNLIVDNFLDNLKL